MQAKSKLVDQAEAPGPLAGKAAKEAAVEGTSLIKGSVCPPTKGCITYDACVHVGGQSLSEMVTLCHFGEFITDHRI